MTIDAAGLDLLSIVVGISITPRIHRTDQNEATRTRRPRHRDGIAPRLCQRHITGPKIV